MRKTDCADCMLQPRPIISPSTVQTNNCNRCTHNHINHPSPTTNQYLLTMLCTIISLTVLAVVSGQDEGGLDGLAVNIPGLPGQDYPIFAFPPETSFLCDNQIQGYYGDPEADCRLTNFWELVS